MNIKRAAHRFLERLQPSSRLELIRGFRVERIPEGWICDLTFVLAPLQPFVSSTERKVSATGSRWYVATWRAWRRAVKVSKYKGPATIVADESS